MHAIDPTVTLVRATPDADEVIASAARLCYASDISTVLDPPPDAEPPARFVRRLMRMGHLSVIEHVSFSFLIEGVSRAMTHQLVRHRLASYSQRSQRYVAEHGFNYIVPPALEGKTVRTTEGEEVDATAYFEETMQLLADRYAKLGSALGSKGQSTNEDARYILPNACETAIFMTMNARELLHYFEERLCQRAQWEIRLVSGKMLEIARDLCPSVFNLAGPKCAHRGYCPEGKLSCGKATEMRARYGVTESDDELQR